MRHLRARRAAFANAAPEALLTIYFGIPACESYIREQIARGLDEDPALCLPDARLTKPMRRVSWYGMATAVVTSSWIGWYSSRTEVDEAIAARVDPNATKPMSLRDILK